MRKAPARITLSEWWRVMQIIVKKRRRYLEAISISYPKHPFSQILIKCKTVRQFLNKLKPLEAKISILILYDGKKWFSELFEVLRGFGREEYESETQSAVDTWVHA